MTMTNAMSELYPNLWGVMRAMFVEFERTNRHVSFSGYSSVSSVNLPPRKMWLEVSVHTTQNERFELLAFNFGVAGWMRRCKSFEAHCHHTGKTYDGTSRSDPQQDVACMDVMVSELEAIGSKWRSRGDKLSIRFVECPIGGSLDEWHTLDSISVRLQDPNDPDDPDDMESEETHSNSVLVGLEDLDKLDEEVFLSFGDRFTANTGHRLLDKQNLLVSAVKEVYGILSG